MYAISRENKFERRNHCVKLSMSYIVLGILLFVFRELTTTILAIWLMILSFKAIEIGKRFN
jgi:hypothetical protein